MALLARLDAADRRVSLLLAVLALALYLRTMAPGLLPGDAGEFQLAAWRLGLAHPTGYPLYLILGYAWQHLVALFGVPPATALNALSALFGAVTVALLYLLLRHWLHLHSVDGIDEDRKLTNIRRGTAGLAATFFATNLTFWSQSLIAEVYTLHALFVVVLLLLVIPTLHASEQPAGRLANRRFIALAAVAGLSLAHHATTLLLLPILLLYIHQQDNLWYRRPFRIWLGILPAFLVPLLLYLYVPLRSSPNASPWYHQSLGESVLSLYAGDWNAFVAFITGQSISAGFYSSDQAFAGLSQVLWLWWYHFRWSGLLLIGLGLATLIRRKQTNLLLLTGSYLLLHQLFNLYYAIGDILVYYIPLYLVATIWLAHGVEGIATGAWLPAQNRHQWRTQLGLLIVAFLFFIPLRAIPGLAAQLDQTSANGARTMWHAILGSSPPANAILVSNDRNDMPPLFYIQYVEGQYQGLTALFPGIAPDDRFLDLGATINTALQSGGNRPVYLIKEMPGINVRFNTESAPPLFRVVSSVQPQFTYPVDGVMGPLLLLGYSAQARATQLDIDLYWRVTGALEDDYTTTVQLFAGGEKIAQNDKSPGGRYYPTSLWKTGEVLHETHTLQLPPADSSVVAESIMIGMYRGTDLTPLAPFLTLALPPDLVTRFLGKAEHATISPF